MPENDSPATLTGYRRRITEYVEAHSINKTGSAISRMALKLHKRRARMRDTDLERIFMHADPTPEQAIKNLEAA